MLSFTQYNQSVSLGKCSTSVSNRFTGLTFNIMRGSNSRLPSALRPMVGDSYVVCLAYVVCQLSLFKSDFPIVVNSCFPTHTTGLVMIEILHHKLSCLIILKYNVQCDVLFDNIEI